MRTTTLSVTATLLLAGCSAGTAAGPTAAPVDWHGFDVPRVVATQTTGPTQKERDAAEAFAAAMAGGGAQLAPRLDSDAHFAFPGIPDARGRDAVVRALDTLFGAFEGRKVAITRVWRTSAQQALEWTLTGSQAGAWMGVAPTHKPVSFRGVTLLWTKDDGSITDVHALFDVALVKAQLGVGPKELLALPPAPAPSGPPQVNEESSTPQEGSDVSAVRSWLDALEGHNEAAYLAGATDDVVVEVPERAQPLRGKDELKAYLRSLYKSIGQLDVTVGDEFGVGRFVVVEYTIAGEQIAPLGWVPLQRDRVIRLHVIDVVEIRDDKIAHVWRYDDPAEALTQTQ